MGNFRKSIYSGLQQASSPGRYAQGSTGVRAPGALHGCLSMRVCSIFVRVSIFVSIACTALIEVSPSTGRRAAKLATVVMREHHFPLLPIVWHPSDCDVSMCKLCAKKPCTYHSSRDVIA